MDIKLVNLTETFDVTLSPNAEGTVTSANSLLDATNEATVVFSLPGLDSSMENNNSLFWVLVALISLSSLSAGFGKNLPKWVFWISLGSVVALGAVIGSMSKGTFNQKLFMFLSIEIILLPLFFIVKYMRSKQPK